MSAPPRVPLAPVALRGAVVVLEPLTRGHIAPLAEVGLHPELWRLQPRPITSLAEMGAYVELALSEHALGASLPFAIVRAADGAMLGSTRYMDIAPAHRRLEIGATWLTPSAQRTGANVEAKWLLLRHAFESLGMQKVVFKTETLNAASRAAILALGATEEATFRRHLIADDGRMRDMVYFAILDSDWPSVDERLRARMVRHRAVP